MNWTLFIGSYKATLDATFRTLLGKQLYFGVLHYKDQYIKLYEAEAHRFSQYETLYVATQEGTKDYKKPTFRGEKRTKNQGKIMTDIPLKKFITVGPDYRNGLCFIYNSYLSEIYQFYVACGYSFPENMAELKENLIEFSRGTNIPVVSFICGTVERHQPQKIIKENFAGGCGELVRKSRNLFKDDKGEIPEKALEYLLQIYCDFSKVLQLDIGCEAVEKRVSLDKKMLMSQMNNLMLEAEAHDDPLSTEYRIYLGLYIDSLHQEKAKSTSKPKGKKTTTRAGKPQPETTEEEDYSDDESSHDSYQESDESIAKSLDNEDDDFGFSK